MSKKLLILAFMGCGLLQAMESGVLEEYLAARSQDKESGQKERPHEKAFLDHWMKDKNPDQKLRFITIMLTTAFQLQKEAECTDLMYLWNGLLSRVGEDVSNQVKGRLQEVMKRQEEEREAERMRERARRRQEKLRTQLDKGSVRSDLRVAFKRRKAPWKPWKTRSDLRTIDEIQSGLQRYPQVERALRDFTSMPDTVSSSSTNVASE